MFVSVIQGRNWEGEGPIDYKALLFLPVIQGRSQEEVGGGVGPLRE